MTQTSHMSRAANPTTGTLVLGGVGARPSSKGWVNGVDIYVTPPG